MASLAGSTNHVSSIEQTTTSTVKHDGNEKSVSPASTFSSPAMVAEKTFADWSIYHSAVGGFSVYMPDRREEKRHLRNESLGLDGQGVQAQFVQLPDTSDPIESWPAIGAIWLRAMCIDNPAHAPLPEGATSTTVTVADLPGTEFVFKKGNEIQKTRLFVIANRTIILTATFVGRESGDDASLPFGEQVDRFLGSLRLSAQPVDRVAASTASGTKVDDGASDSFAVVDRYLCELTGSDLSEDLIRTRVDDLKAAALKAQASPEEVLTLLRSAKAEAEARGMSSELAIRAVTGTLGAKTQRRR